MHSSPDEKTRPDELACLGGKPLFCEALMVGRPNLGERDVLFKRMAGALDRRWLTNDGPLLLEMEQQFAGFLGVTHCVAVANATLGLQLLARALALDGDVLMPSFTFIGTARAFEWQGSRPVFCDVLPGSHTLDPEAVRQAMTPAIRAIVGVHLWGVPCEIDALQVIADEFGVPLIFDAAHAMGSTFRGRRIGGFGKAEVFSLHATKMIHSLEGGLITTDDADLAHRLRLMRSYGIANVDVFEGTGINAKMNEFSAAMALTNLAGYDALARHNRSLQRAYAEAIHGTPGLELVTAAAGIAPDSGHYAVLRVDAGRAGVTRDRLREVLEAENVYTRRYFWPGCHRCPPYDARADHAPMPVTERLTSELLQLPTGQQMSAADAHAIGQLLARAVAHGQ